MTVSAIERMPKSKKSLAILQYRANLLAKSEIDSIEQNEVNSYITFRLGKSERYGIPYQYAKEVMQNVVITKIPTAPSFITGVINRRGALIAILNLKEFFRIAKSEESKSTFIIIVKRKGMTLGILADEIEGSSTYNSLELDTPLPSEGLTKQEYILGLHNGIVTILNIEVIMQDQQLHVR